LWLFAQGHADAIAAVDGASDASAAVTAARREIHLTLKQANYDYERLQYNTVVSAAMKMLNALEGVPATASGAAELAREGLSILLRTLYPIAPHVTWTLWNDLGYAKREGDLLDAPWPEVDPSALVQDEIELVLQVNGKLRGKLLVPATATEEEIKVRAAAAPEVAKHGNGAPAKFIKVVPGRLVNVVV
jgi:leucyl-tRNA synthetase